MIYLVSSRGDRHGSSIYSRIDSILVLGTRNICNEGRDIICREGAVGANLWYLGNGKLVIDRPVSSIHTIIRMVTPH